MTDFNNPLGLSEVAVAAMRQHAKEVWPQECCGVVVHGEYIAQENRSPEPEKSFLIGDSVWEEYPDVEGIIHSHCAPQYGIEPTEIDMVIQRKTAVPWGIIHAGADWTSKPLWFGKFRLDEPLEGRRFIHGVLDCYSLIRSWYWQKRSVELMDFPRDNNWWMEADKDLYRENFEKCGFSSVDPSRLEEGDVVMFSMKGEKTHHAGIYLEGGLLLHHLCGRTSCVDSYSRWKKFATHHVRRVA